MKPTRLNRFQLRQLQRLRRTSRRVRIALAVAATAVVAAFVLPIVTGRTTPRWYQLQAAKMAYQRAQVDGADAWAPDAMREARAMLQVAVVEHRHQELRFLPLRDFTQAEGLLQDAQDKAGRASQQALRRRTGARNATQEAITRAAQAVGRGVNFAAAMHFGPYDRITLQKSKLALEEAELLLRAGRYDLAADRARIATQQAQLVSSHAAQAASRYVDAGQINEWRRMVDDTVNWSRRTGSLAIVVYKEKHQLLLFKSGKPVRNYTAELGYNSIGDKARSGDAATPEGRYHITSKKGIGQSGYHMALLLDYPNTEDRRRFEAARRAGRIARNASLGGLIEIHGEGGRGKDWTKGCVALTNTDIQDLFQYVGVGTPVTIVGGDGNGGSFTKLVDMQRAGADTGLD
jgi:L,D-peptidoglycan transpeptidase YkuD (ErfK/YbiS/YcfS/YnhG family)